MYTISEVRQLKNSWSLAFETLLGQIQGAVRLGQCDDARLYRQQYESLYQQVVQTLFQIGSEASTNPDWGNIVSVYRDIQIESATWNRNRTDMDTLIRYCQTTEIQEETFTEAPAEPQTTVAEPSGPPPPQNTTQSVNAARETAIATPSARDSAIEAQNGDWRVRLSLAPDAGAILYRAPYQQLQESILHPLAETDGVIFPYTPSIQTTYVAAYEPTILTHSNYKLFNYTGSYVDAVTISCDFTAQDTFEANYVLAVIHFFRSITKMFYGQDEIVPPGTPPPLCFLTGLGEFQFNMHPLVISSFTYNLPNNVNYVRASNITSGPAGANRGRAASRDTASDLSSNRLNGQVGQGGMPFATVWPNNLDGRPGTSPTYVPTSMNISITAYPVISRNKQSNQFSLQQYATGELLQGSRIGGGFW